MKKIVDVHTKAAIMVAEYEYFVVTRQSLNENLGLLINTGVRKLKAPEGKRSRYWDGNYWRVLVECPNGETRQVCCDALKPSTPAFYYAQKKVFPQAA